MAVYGNAGAPSQNTINYDAILSTSLSNYSRTLNDNISKSNAFWYMIQQNGMYLPVNGGFNIAFPLVYALGHFDWYDGYDLGTSIQFNLPVLTSLRENRRSAP